MNTMRLSFIATLMSAFLNLPAQAQNPARPPAAFAPCAACHSVDGGQGLGPSLKGVVGRKAASVTGFNYSRAMKSAGITWDEETLDAFITEPQKVVPGNHMPFSGLAEAQERTSVIAFLKTWR